MWRLGEEEKSGNLDKMRNASKILRLRSLSVLGWQVGVRDGQTNIISCIEDTAPVLYGKEGVDLEGEAFNLLVRFCSYPHLWSRDLGSERKNEIPDISS